ncbi:hypothetical protein JCGZ_10748 [Jatropha curcas]|uniref:Retrotransposon gag domain-containing protein n=1 Tax=Jatropha curcas TaxID=180498 RepID=A0A067LEW5_JATCU|nr:uncharacterized protein LOC105635940 isoform X2 [Jatropha curcas]KDP47021.1 hypothetical protein JCGZ_10748 [Jatropha curcas]
MSKTARIKALERRVDEIVTLMNHNKVVGESTSNTVINQHDLRETRIESLEEKLRVIETTLSELAHSKQQLTLALATQGGEASNTTKRIDRLETRISKLEGLPSKLEATHKDFCEYVKSIVEEVQTKVQSFSTELAKVTGIMNEFAEIKGKVNLLVAAAGNTSGPTQDFVRIEIPEPSPFKGIRDAREVDNFLFDIEAYFEAINYHSNEQRLKLVPMYLIDDGKLWWRGKVKEMKSGRITIKTWEEFCQVLRSSFYPTNVSYNARRKLSELQHTDSIREYVRNFSHIMLEIPNMSEIDKLFNFMCGLQPWAEESLNNMGVKDLNSAMIAAESLGDYRWNNSKRKFNQSVSGENCPSKWAKPSSGVADQGNSSPNKGENAQRKFITTTPENKKSSNPCEERSNSKALGGGFTRLIKCFICKGPHKLSECPGRAAPPRSKAEDGKIKT